jgi:hypothetical protein
MLKVEIQGEIDAEDLMSAEDYKDYVEENS